MSSRLGIAAAFERYRDIVGDWDEFAASLERPLPACLWTNTLRTTAAELASHLEVEGIAARALAWQSAAVRLPDGAKPGKLWPLAAGLCHVQEEAAMVAVSLLDPRPGERVLDLCASPGNKTAQIAQALRGGGTVIANEPQLERHPPLRHTVERLGLVNVSITRSDGTSYPESAGLFDRVLVDAPCSCEGTVRKSPSVARALAAGGYREAIRYQIRLLERALALVRPGGRVVYSTCSFAPEENELVVDSVLRSPRGAGCTLAPARIPGLVSSPGLTRWQERSLDPALESALRIWPHQNDSGGSFAAVIVKDAGAAASPPGAEPPRGDQDLPAGELDSALSYLEERFGLARAAFAGVELRRASREGYHAIALGHRPPREPPPEGAGVFVLRTAQAVPMLSTAGVLLVGRAATRNTVAVDRGQLGSYLRRESFAVSAAQTAACGGRGPVIVSHRGAAVGAGFLRPEPGGSGGMLESQFPKGWSWGLGS